jgi:hypothetical protein
MGYVAGGLLAGAIADALGFSGAIALVAALTALSGFVVAVDLRDDQYLKPMRDVIDAHRSNLSGQAVRGRA